MKPWIPRRVFLTGAFAAAGVAAIAGAYEAFLFRSRPKGPYGDVLAPLDDLSDAPVVGRAYLADARNFNARQAAAQLRTRLQQQSFSDVLAADIAGNQLAEAGRWVLPESLAVVCALAVST
jgi:hypothetical protein